MVGLSLIIVVNGYFTTINVLAPAVESVHGEQTTLPALVLVKLRAKAGCGTARAIYDGIMEDTIL